MLASYRFELIFDWVIERHYQGRCAGYGQNKTMIWSLLLEL